MNVTASDHSVAVGGDVGGSVTNIHGDGNVVGDHSESNVEKAQGAMSRGSRVDLIS